MNFSIPISRRDFFKVLGITTAGAMLSNSGEEKKVSAAESHFNFDNQNIPQLLSADVCVCGGGPAGTAAAWSLKNNISANSVEWDKIPENLRSYVSQG